MHKAEQVERYRAVMGEQATRRQQALSGIVYRCCARPIDQPHAPNCETQRNLYSCCGAHIFGPHKETCPLALEEAIQPTPKRKVWQPVPDLDEPFYKDDYR